MFQGQRHRLRTMAQCRRPRWLGLRRTASPRVWLPGSVPHGAPAHLLGAAAIAVVVGNRRAHHLWSVIPAVPRCTPVLAAHQLQTSILASTSRSVPRCSPVAAEQLRTSIPASTIRSVPRCSPVAAEQLRTSIPASTIRSAPRFTPVLAAHQLQTSIPASTSSPGPQMYSGPGGATHPKTAIPADTPHKCIEVQLVPIGLIVVSTARNRGPRCRHHNCFADDREARRQDRFYPSGDEFEDGVAHRQNPSHGHLSKEACLPRRFPSPWSVEEPDPKLDRRCFIVPPRQRPCARLRLFRGGAGTARGGRPSDRRVRDS